MNIIHALILAAIEGITEFLPISSTGHMILASSLLNIQDEAFVRTFEISIQLGAILAIVTLYAGRFWRNISMYFKLGAAFFPTAVAGFLAYGFIKAHLFNPVVVSVSLIAGGIILIVIDKKVETRQSETEGIENISFKNAFFIGLAQCVSMIPGVSRAAATIIGGVFNGLDKKQATEFSFLLAVPTMFAATGYDLYKTRIGITGEQAVLLGIGLTIAFFTALIAVKIFLKIVESYGFRHFGYYRIVLGALFLIFMHGSKLI